MTFHFINADDMSGMKFVERRDSKGCVHKVFFAPNDGGPDMQEIFGQDSVQVSCDGKFKIGDRVRPNRSFIENVLHNQIPVAMVAGWSKGFPITEIGPEGFPYEGHHNVELGDGAEVLFLSTCDIEKI